MIAIAIDDEPVALDIVKSHASKVPFLSLLTVFTNAFDALTYLQQNSVDLIFLDIKMPDINGIDFFKSLNKPPLVIFTTAYSEHAVQSFDLDAVDYLLKPFSFVRFLKACNKAYSLQNLHNSGKEITEEDYIFIKDGYENIKVHFKDILFIQSFGNYCKLNLIANKTLTSRATLSEMEEVLSNDFIRVHRMYILNKTAITKFNRSSLFIHEIEIPVGPSYKTIIEELL